MLVVVVICKYVMWCVVFFLMILRPQCSTRAATLVPYTTLFRSRGGTWPRRVAQHARCALAPGHLRHHGVEGEVPLGIIAARHVLGLFHGGVVVVHRAPPVLGIDRLRDGRQCDERGDRCRDGDLGEPERSEEHTSELPSLMRT